MKTGCMYAVSMWKEDLVITDPHRKDCAWSLTLSHPVKRSPILPPGFMFKVSTASRRTFLLRRLACPWVMYLNQGQILVCGQGVWVLQGKEFISWETRTMAILILPILSSLKLCCHWTSHQLLLLTVNILGISLTVVPFGLLQSDGTLIYLCTPSKVHTKLLVMVSV